MKSTEKFCCGKTFKNGAGLKAHLRSRLHKATMYDATNCNEQTQELPLVKMFRQAYEELRNKRKLAFQQISEIDAQISSLRGLVDDQSLGDGPVPADADKAINS